jgi:hypothetical protein
MGRLMNIIVLACLSIFITTDAISQTCDILRGSDRARAAFEQPEWKLIYQPLISGCSGGRSTVDTSFVRSYPTPFSVFVYINVYKNSLSSCQAAVSGEIEYFRGVYQSLKDNTNDGLINLDVGIKEGGKFSEQCRAAILKNLDKVFGAGGSSGSNVSAANNFNKPNANIQPRADQSQQSSQQNQAAQQQSQQAQQRAAQNQFPGLAGIGQQARADEARHGKRRRHEPENEASHCIQPDFGGLYGGMKNTCDFKVWYTYCGYRPKENSWLTGMSCEKQSFGSDSVSPGRTSASHTKGVEMLHWIACKEPAWALDAEFVEGQGVSGRCYTVGGN